MKALSRAKKGVCCCYILRCADGSFYTGWTSDLRRRLAQHNAGSGGAYTRAHRPVALAYFDPVPDSRTARLLEAAVKRLTRAEKEALVAGRKRPRRGKSRRRALPVAKGETP
jgi:putative endonuclease